VPLFCWRHIELYQHRRNPHLWGCPHGTDVEAYNTLPIGCNPSEGVNIRSFCTFGTIKYPLLTFYFLWLESQTKLPVVNDEVQNKCGQKEDSRRGFSRCLLQKPNAFGDFFSLKK